MIKLIRFLQSVLPILLLLNVEIVHSQNTANQKGKENSRFSFGAGYARSNMENKYADDVLAKSIELKISFNIASSIRFVANVENQLQFNLPPRWHSVKNTYFDVLTNTLGFFANRQGAVYGMGGLTFQRFSGRYSGFGNITHLNRYIRKEYIAYYYGVLIGVGIERCLYKNIWIWGEVRGRMIWNNESTVTKKEPTLNGQLSLGIKLNFPVFNKIFRGLGDKYHWF